MKNFIGNFWASLLAFVVGLVVVGFLNVLVFAGLMANMSLGKMDTFVQIADSTVMTVDMKTIFKEGRSTSELNINDMTIEVDLSLEESESVDYLKAVNAILCAADDDRIVAINLKPDGLTMDIAQLVEFRNALAMFAKKKPIYVFTENFESLGAYFLSSIANYIQIGRLGNIPWVGLSTTSMHFKGLLEKLGAEVEVFRCGKFKSAVEPFTERKMSAENRKQTELLLNTTWGYIVSGVAQARGVDSAMLQKLASDLTICSVQEAVKHKFVDKIGDAEQFEQMFADIYGGDKKKIKTVSLKDYMTTFTMEGKKSSNGKREYIGVIYAAGDIMPSDDGSMGDVITAEDMLTKLKKAEKDSTVKAVVLRVNSPGGSALDSEIICAQVEKLRKVKPVVVSMGNEAASGGYYISALADRIITSPLTLTGSIGVFSLGVNVQGLLTKQLGVTFDNVKTNKSADFGFGRMSPAQRAYIQKSVDDIYVVFKQRVSQGRNLTMEQVEEVASGRVWTGIDAQRIGLVDGVGGLNVALEVASQLAHIEEVNIKEISNSRDMLPALMKRLKRFVKTESELPLLDENIKYLKSVVGMSGKVMAITPVVLNIH